MIDSTARLASATMPVPMSRGIRALLLDDSNFDRARIRRLSDKTELSVDIDEVGSIAELDEAVARENYDLILIDFRLPVGNGMQALDLVLQNDLNRHAGKIMITGDITQETAIAAMRSGCHDFLTKETMDVAALRRAMLNALSTAHQSRYLVQNADYQRELIRQGLVAAMQDGEVQGNVISLLRKELLKSNGPGTLSKDRLEADEMDGLLSGFSRDDHFVFH